MDVKRYIEEYSGFFAGTTPGHADVRKYFTQSNFASMFGRDQADLPAGLTWAEVREVAHQMINERKELDYA